MKIELKKKATHESILIADIGHLLPFNEEVYKEAWLRINTYSTLVWKAEKFKDGLSITVDGANIPMDVTSHEEFKYWYETSFPELDY